MPLSGTPVATVTGAGSGIGRSISLMLAREGFRVALVGRDRAKLDRVAAEIDAAGSITSATRAGLVAPADLADPASCAAIISATVAAFGRLDVLINNAGWSPLVPIAQISAEQARDIFSINALTPVWTTQAAWQVFARQHGQESTARLLDTSGTPRRTPCIVNVSSMASVDPFPGLGVYGAAKAAVNTLTRATSNEGRGIGLRAFAVAPGAVETDLLRSLFSTDTVPSERCLKPDDVSRVILDCVLGAYDSQNGDTIWVPSP